MLWVNQANPKPWHFYPYGIRPARRNLSRWFVTAPTQRRATNQTLASFNSRCGLYNAVAPRRASFPEIFDSAVIGARFEKTYDLPTLVRNKGIQIWLGGESQLIGSLSKRSINSLSSSSPKNWERTKKPAFHSEHLDEKRRI